jgi:hypothetical protein
MTPVRRRALTKYQDKHTGKPVAVQALLIIWHVKFIASLPHR